LARLLRQLHDCPGGRSSGWLVSWCTNNHMGYKGICLRGATMNVRNLTVIVVGMFVIATAAIAQNQGAKGSDKPGDADAMMARMHKAEPGSAHQQLGKRAGDWTTASKLIPKAGEKPMESNGRVKIQPILGGRFLSEETVPQGKGPTALKLWGYNNGSNKYEAVWTWTLSTSIMTLNGESDDGGRTVRYIGPYDDENGDRRTLEITTRQIDDDHFSVEIRGKNPDGTPAAAVETTYSRAK